MYSTFAYIYIYTYTYLHTHTCVTSSLCSTPLPTMNEAPNALQGPSTQTATNSRLERHPNQEIRAEEAGRIRRRRQQPYR